MKRTLLALAISGMFVGRARTHDVAFTYRMGAGFPGDVNRTHPASVVAGLTNTTNPMLRYGDPVLIDTTNGYRRFIAGDTALTKINGVLVRPYPTQQASGGMTATIGGATPPTSGVQDILEHGFIMTQIPTGQTVKKGDPCFVWCAADSGSHKQGGFENATSAGNTCSVTNAVFWGPADASGNVEVRVGY